MTRDEFIDAVAGMVAGLQVQRSMPGGAWRMGAALEPFEALLHEANGGFGWTDKDKCRYAFEKVLAGD